MTAREEKAAAVHPQLAVLSVRKLLDDIHRPGLAAGAAAAADLRRRRPKLDQPLPRAPAPDIDAAVMNAVARLGDPFARVGLTLLRGTGLRVRDLLDLVGSIIDYGPAGSWLKVPRGKLATERMVPLAATTITVLDECIALRGAHRPLLHSPPSHLPACARPTAGCW